jgi:flagellum-specific peptidoglycan hydrolase FlgJ
MSWCAECVDAYKRGKYATDPEYRERIKRERRERYKREGR